MRARLPQPTTLHRVSLFTSVLLVFLFACLCLGLSWYMLLVKSRRVRGSTLTALLLLEGSSVVFAVAGHVLLLRYVLSATPPVFVLKLATKITNKIMSRQGKHKRDDAYGENSMSPLLAAEGGSPRTFSSSSPWAATGRRVRTAFFFWLPLCVVVGIHVIVHRTIPYKHRQSQEVVMALARCGVDTAAVVLVLSWCIVRLARQQLRMSSPRWQRSWAKMRRLLMLVALLCILLIVSSAVQLIYSIDTLAHIRMCILDNHECDPCKAEGMQFNPAMQASWVWPALTPRRLFTFYTGTEACRDTAASGSIGHVDGISGTLVVSSRCSDGSKPRIYLHWPERSELHGRDDFYLPEVRKGNKQYHIELEAKYGTAHLAEEKGVVVHRDADRIITAVEIKPELLEPISRKPQSEAEKRARARWPGDRVLEITLGESAAYTVHCPAVPHEEYFMFPVRATPNSVGPYSCHGEEEKQPLPEAAEKKGGKAFEEPAGNVLMIVFDAVSRQEVRRSFPRFAAWVNDFSKRHGGGHRVMEPEAWTTLGISTSGNFVPILAGTSIVGMNVSSESEFDVMNRTVFNLAKKTYGDGIGTAMTVGSCSDFFEVILGNREASAGMGERLQGVDHYTYQPLCHLEYSGLESNFQGPYSIVKRCITGRHVHEHILDYAAHLTKRRLRDSAAAYQQIKAGDKGSACRGSVQKGQFFFDLHYFMDGHEGTHTAITLVDEGLTAFMNRLEKEMGFFKNPLNTLIFAADHGNHMGHYYEFTNAGQFERTSSAMLFFIHPEVMHRVDKRKGNTPGTAEQHFTSRLTRLNTPLDLFMTLGDLAGVTAKPFEEYMSTRVVPTSMFDAREGAPHLVQNCSDISTPYEHYVCSQKFCVKRDGHSKSK